MIKEKAGHPHALKAVEKFNEVLSKNSLVLDVGSGQSERHAELIRQAGHTVETSDFFDINTYTGDYNTLEIKKVYDGLWCAHCLEHQLNVQSFLRKIHTNLKENGWLAITVPPLKHLIVGGHLSLWNAGLLLYNLVIAGFNCKDAKVKTYDYNISVIVKKKTLELPQLKYDNGDLLTLSDYFPPQLQRTQRGDFDGQIQEINW
jgi:SAM-dependent methyltransferase